MSKALSHDLRTRVLAAITGGLSCRQAALRFGVSAASAIRWRALERLDADAASIAAQRLGSGVALPAQAGFILGLVEATPDITLAEIRSELAGKGGGFGMATLWRFFDQRKITLKKRRRMPPMLRQAQQDRPDVLKQRQAWFDGQPDLDPSRLMCIDETPASAGRGSGPPPPWPARTGARRRASGCASAFRRVTRRRRPSWQDWGSAASSRRS